MSAESSQLPLGFRSLRPSSRPASWGGRRAGAGRPPRGRRAGVSHLARPALAARFPVLVTWRLASGVPDVRSRRLFSVVLRALSGARVREVTGRVVHFSVQSNHIHLIAEARDAAALSRFLQGVAIRVARALNGRLGRSGRVFGDRFHSRILRTPLEVHRAIRYVLVNARKHAAQRRAPFPAGWMDGCSSAAWFDGWSAPRAVERAIGLAHGQVRGAPSPGMTVAPVSAPRTWLLETGWRRHGLLDADATPGSDSHRSRRPAVERASG